ncbi:transmembrane protein, putative (macronuclear) [Tetrahymena thermophila SB210]|uniref:Transmembrane protein, putative n=1 Tax=Tetrahymena thermophila (strain SB210) TaxID=312017 RepID=Q22LS9_TETTS|nr:transmembrane protein, putative [Tetrahymena thermophila SB210]EAR86187.2 transmembrane protein, putative [Tetrahymena thermophila SB210]|eukprot:XP_976782.2 transmembrane protein, putative [Tetrahymena thermophila SB210]
MKRKQQLFYILSLLTVFSVLVTQVQSQQLINNCAKHYDVFDYYNPNIVRKICTRCKSTLTETYVLRYDFQECIRTVNFLDGLQNCQQLTLDGKCKQTLSYSSVVNADNWTIIPQNRTDDFSSSCAQVNSLGKCVYPIFPHAMINVQGSDTFYKNFECAFVNSSNYCQKTHYGFIFTANQNYFLFDFQNYEKLNKTIVSKYTDRLYCVKGYTFTETGCIQDGSSFPTIPNCAEQMGDYCYTCNQGYTLQNTRQSCQQIGDGKSCLTFENIRGVNQCILCDNSYSLYRGQCYQNIALSHQNIRFGSFCKAPYYGKGCTQVQKNLPLNCGIVDSQKGTCAQCTDIENYYFDIKSNSCKSRVFSIGCAVKHPVSDSCYVAYCQPGLRYRYPLPTFYPPTYTFVDAKYNNIWRNQFLGSKSNITQTECIADVNNPLDVNCQTYDQYGQSCVQCKPNYWLLQKNDGTRYYYCSNDLNQFKSFSQYCLTFNNQRTRCTSCQPGYTVNQSGDCVQGSDKDNCLIYDSSGNCSLCKEGFYPYLSGCSNQDLCWLSLDPNTNSYYCSECRQQTDKQIIQYNNFCSVTNNGDNCAKYNLIGNAYKCAYCQDGYIINSSGTCISSFREWVYTIATQSSTNLIQGWNNNGYYLRQNGQDVTCQQGYIKQQCDTCSQNCLSCIDDICYKCQTGFVLNSFYECVPSA